MKKFQSMTIPTAIARVAFLAMKSGDINPPSDEDLKKIAKGGSTKCRIGILIATPATFTAINIPS